MAGAKGTPEKRRGWGVSDIVLIAVMLFLLAKAFGLTRMFLGVDPFGFDAETSVVWVALTAAIGVLYKKVEDITKTVTDQLDRFSDKISEQGERIARLEGKLGVS